MEKHTPPNTTTTAGQHQIPIVGQAPIDDNSSSTSVDARRPVHMRDVGGVRRQGRAAAREEGSLDGGGGSGAVIDWSKKWFDVPPRPPFPNLPPKSKLAAHGTASNGYGNSAKNNNNLTPQHYAERFRGKWTNPSDNFALPADTGPNIDFSGRFASRFGYLIVVARLLHRPMRAQCCWCCHSRRVCLWTTHCRHGRQPAQSCDGRGFPSRR